MMNHFPLKSLNTLYLANKNFELQWAHCALKTGMKVSVSVGTADGYNDDRDAAAGRTCLQNLTTVP